MKNDGCLGRTLKIGVGCLLLIAACVLCPMLLFRGGGAVLGVFTSATAVDVSGECSREAVEEHFGEDGFIQAFSALDAADDGDGGFDFSDVDVAQLRNDREELESLDVPPCLRGVVAEEIELMDTVIAGVEVLQVDETGLVESLRSARTVIGAIVHGRRVFDAKDALVERTGAQLD